MRFAVRGDCRLCGSASLARVLDLPATPLANEFPRESAIGFAQEEFPLFLASCRECGHVQLPVVVSPERLFRDYVYVSGTSPVFVDHFRRYAESMISRLALDPLDLVVEVGSNDGTLLRFFKDAGMRVLGIDPAKEIAEDATERGLETWPEFFDEAVAERIARQLGQAQLVVANNVFAHADDLGAIARAAKLVLEPSGLFVFEVSYLPDVLRGTLFDTVYHEHLSYHSVFPLIGFFRKLGMSLLDAQLVDTHGGSIRVSVSARDGLPYSAGVMARLAEERALGLVPDAAEDERPSAFASFAGRISERGEEVKRTLRATKMAGGTVAGYGAPAKATTLLRAFGIEDLVDFIVDDSPHKQGRWMPGGRVPVYPSSAIAQKKPDLVLVLAWNFAESIVEKLAGYRAGGGRVVVPLPRLSVV